MQRKPSDCWLVMQYMDGRPIGIEVERLLHLQRQHKMNIAAVTYRIEVTEDFLAEDYFKSRT